MEREIEQLNVLAKRRRWLDIGIAVFGVGVFVALGLFAYSYLALQARDRSSTLSARAVANLSEAVRQRPNDTRARILLADALAADGRQQQAVEQYKAALQISKDDPSALAGLAQLAMARKEWDTAATYWKRIIADLSSSEFASQDLRLEKAYFYLGSTLLESKDYEEAANYLREALRLRRDASDTHFLLATAYRELGLDLKYREELEIALKFDPTMPEGNYEYAKLLRDDGDEAGAAEHFRLSADNAPPGRREPFDELATFGSVEQRLESAQAALAKGDQKAALVDARIAVALDPNDVEAIRIVARLFEKQDQKASAQAAWDRLLSIDPQDAEAAIAMKRLTEKAK